jgi:MFS family permease
VKRILPTIVLAQFLCTSLWFAGNAILPDLIAERNLNGSFLAHLTSAVQFGFITGTLVFAVLSIADRISPSKVFAICALIAGAVNMFAIVEGLPASFLLLSRFLTGFFLAGIYPVGMKIASDYFQQGLGRSLGFLVGALVLGTAFPHLLKTLTTEFPWEYVIYGTSILSTLGGVTLYYLVPDGPFRKSGQSIKVTAFMDGFRHRDFRSAAFGYFGHMWELYTFWAYVPTLLALYAGLHSIREFSIPFWSFLIIGSGSVACVVGGLLAQRYGAKRIATISLSLSGFCCLLSPVFILQAPTPLFLSFLFFWGLVVIADSPLFSTLVAQLAPTESRGTSLTIVNCIGFSITIISIQLLNAVSSMIPSGYLYWVLALGPAMGVAFLTLGNAARPKEKRPNR